MRKMAGLLTRPALSAPSRPKSVVLRWLLLDKYQADLQQRVLLRVFTPFPFDALMPRKASNHFHRKVKHYFLSHKIFHQKNLQAKNSRFSLICLFILSNDNEIILLQKSNLRMFWKKTYCEMTIFM